MAETIAEFVAKLGLKVDKAQEQRFNATLGNLSKTLVTMAAGLTAAATAIQATVIAVSKSFDNLYFAAQRTNSTVAGIKALSYAFSQIGSSGNEAQSALEGLAKAMRTNPGISGWLNAQGVATAGRKTEDILGDAIEKFRKAPYYIGAQFAQLIGVPEETFNKAAQQWEQVQKYAKEYREAQARFGVDPDKAAKTSNELMTGFRGLMAHLDALLTKITVALQPQLNQILKDISGWFEQHQDQIVRVLDQILKAVGGLIEDLGRLAKALEPVLSKFADLVEALTGDGNSLKVALEVLTAVTLAGFVAKFMGFLGALAINPYFLALMAMMGIGYDLFVATPEQKMGLGGGVNDAINGPAGEQGWFARQQNRVRGWLGMGPVDNKGNALPADRTIQGYRKSLSGGGSAPPNRAGLAPIKTKSGKTVWVAKEYQGQFQGFVNDLEAQGYKIDELGGYANRRNVNNPSKMSAHAYGMAIDVNESANPNRTTQTDLPANTAELAKKWGLGWGMNWTRVKDPMHFSTDPHEGGRLMSPEELKTLQDDQAQRLKDKQSMLFNGTPLGGGASRMASISNRTSITIFGSRDPAGTAANLGGEQSRLASDLIRNSQSAFV